MMNHIQAEAAVTTINGMDCGHIAKFAHADSEFAYVDVLGDAWKTTSDGVRRSGTMLETTAQVVHWIREHS